MNNDTGFGTLCRKMGLHTRSYSIWFRSGTLGNKLRLFLSACGVTMENSCVGEMPSI